MAAVHCRRLYVSMLVALTMIAMSVVAVPGPAAAATGNWSPPNTPTSKVTPVPGKRISGAFGSAGAAFAAKPFKAPAVSLPAAGQSVVPLAPPDSVAPTRGLRAPSDPASAVRVGTSPLFVSPLSVPVGSSPQLRVSFVGPAASQQAGVGSGLMWTVSRADLGTGAASARVELDPAALAGLSGGNFSSRLRLVALPACAVTTPTVAACQVQTPVPFSRDAATGRLAATVDLSASGASMKGAPVAASTVVHDGPAADAGVRPIGSGAVVMAAGSAPAGSAGDYSATSVKPSNQWSVGGATGNFTYSYPITVPPSLGGAAPSVELSYTSSDVDGQTASTNAQSSSVGTGWSYEPGFIERSYLPCSKDGLTGSGDTCWGYNGQEVSLNGNGMGGQLVLDDTAHTWRVSGDTGAKVELKTGGPQRGV